MEERRGPGETKEKGNTSSKKIFIDRLFHLPLNKIWHAWTQPESLKKWWGPKDFTCPFASMDFRIGGKYLYCMRSPEGEETWTTGIFKEIDPYKKLFFTDSFSNKKGNILPASALDMPGEWPLELLIMVTFTEEGENTRIALQHEGVPAEMYENCIAGWNEFFDKLDRNIE